MNVIKKYDLLLIYKMKTLLTILLLFAYSYTWGQDVFLKFQPLTFIDTIYNKQVFDSLNRIDNFKTDDIMVLREIRSYDGGGDYYYLVIKKSSYYISYHLPHENVANYGYVDSTSIKIQNNMLTYEAHDSYRFFSSVVFVIIDLQRKSYCEIPKTYSESSHGFDYNTDSAYSYYLDINCDILFDGKILEISNSECKQSEDYPILGNCANHDYDGEYHYINGNFVKVKSKE